jgi:uncharacterized membrane protein HdeD (DUF308 family)
MEYMIFAAIVSLLFGILFLMSPETLGKWGGVSNQTVMVLDEKLSAARTIVGVILLLMGLFISWSAFGYGSLWYLHIIGIIAIFFGLLYLISPQGLKTLSSICNVVLLSTDEVAMASRQIIGIIMLVFGAYMLYAVYYLSGK